MGGRWDATSAHHLRGHHGCWSDHTCILEDTLEAIAAEKAAIVASGRTCVLGGNDNSSERPGMAFCPVVSAGVVPTLLVADKPEDVEGEGFCWSDI